MSGFLAQACAEARARVAEAQRSVTSQQLRGRAGELPRPPRFTAALMAPGVSVIAEIKRASPSRGHLALIPDPAGLGRAYAAGGAAAISVLTEPQHFAGTLEDLAAVTDAVTVPVLRKDFVVDPYQIWEAAAAGAAAVLLIIATLEQEELGALLRTAAQARLEVLVETHEEHEIARAAGAYDASELRFPLVLGINARDLNTLEVDPGRFAALRRCVPDEAITVAESGVRDVEDVRRLAELGADAVLVGESLASAPDPASAVRRLAAAGATVHEGSGRV